MKNENAYTASFTAAGLLFEEFLSLEHLLFSEDFEALIDTEVEQNTVLSIKTESARKRITQEIVKRWENAPAEYWDMFFSVRTQEQKLTLFYLCLKTYKLVMDFHIEVTLKKWKSKSLGLDAFDLQMRLDEIASIDEAVMSWSDSTQRKTLTVYKRMLAEAGFLKKDKLLKPQGIQPEFWDYYFDIGEGWFMEACFHSKNER